MLKPVSIKTTVIGPGIKYSQISDPLLKVHVPTSPTLLNVWTEMVLVAQKWWKPFHIGTPYYLTNPIPLMGKFHFLVLFRALQYISCFDFYLLRYLYSLTSNVIMHLFSFYFHSFFFFSEKAYSVAADVNSCHFFNCPRIFFNFPRKTAK